MFLFLFSTVHPGSFPYKKFGKMSENCEFVLDLRSSSSFIREALSFLNQKPPILAQEALVLHSFIQQLSAQLNSVLLNEDDEINTQAKKQAASISNCSTVTALGFERDPVVSHQRTPKKKDSENSPDSRTSLSTSTSPEKTSTSEDGDDAESAKAIGLPPPLKHKQQITKESIGAFSDKYMQLPDGQKSSFRNSVEFLVARGVTPKTLDVWYIHYVQKFLQGTNIFDVSTGTGDCQLRAVLSYILKSKIRNGDDPSVSEKCLTALCGWLSEFGQKPYGDQSIFGIDIAQNSKEISSEGIALFDNSVRKIPFNPKQASIFLAHLKNIIATNTLSEIFGAGYFKNPPKDRADPNFLNTTKISGISIPTVSHRKSLPALLEHVDSRAIPYCVRIVHFSTINQLPGRFSIRYDIATPSTIKTDDDHSCIILDYYTINYTPEQQVHLAEVMERDLLFRRLLLDFAESIDRKNLSVPDGHARQQFGKDLLIDHFLSGVRAEGFFHVFTGSYDKLTKEKKYSNLVQNYGCFTRNHAGKYGIELGF